VSRRKDENPDQLSFKFELDKRFVKVMTAFLHDGKEGEPSTVGKMGSSAFHVLVFIRSMVGNNSRSFPSQKFIANQTGLSKSTIKRSVEKLIEMNFVNKVQVRGHNEYQLNEKVLMKSLAPEEYGDVVLSQPFSPRGSKKIQIDKHHAHFEETGELPAGSPIRIEINLTINAPVLNDHSQAIFIDKENPPEWSKKPWLQNALARGLKAGEVAIRKELEKVTTVEDIQVIPDIKPTDEKPN